MRFILGTVISLLFAAAGLGPIIGGIILMAQGKSFGDVSILFFFGLFLMLIGYVIHLAVKRAHSGDTGTTKRRTRRGTTEGGFDNDFGGE